MCSSDLIIPAIVTPFTADGELNEPAVRRLIDRLLAAGVHGLFVLGTNGEFFAMTEDEKVELVRMAADQIGGRVPLYAGAGAITTAETVRLARRLRQAGADALSVITPYFVPVSQSELQAHYEAVAAAAELPIVLYNIPARTGVVLEAGTVESLSRLPNVVGVKDSSGNFEHILQLIQRTGPDFAVLAGTDSLILSTLLAGGAGAVAASANAAPETVVSIYEHWKAGRLDEARRSQAELAAVRGLMQLGTIPAALKEMVSRLGIDVGPPRLPVRPADDGMRRTIADGLRKAGLLKEAPSR